MKNINIITIVVAGLIFGTSSCKKDFLDRQPIDFVSPGSFHSENDVLLALNGTYKAFFVDKTEPVLTDFMTDNGFMDKTANGMVDFWDQAQNNNSIYSIHKWTRDYTGILRANTVLNYIDQVSMDSTKKEQYRGEALALRAFFYADLIEFYGAVPFRLKPEGIAAKDVPRTDKNIILDTILNDLNRAAERLPLQYSNQDDKGRITKGAAIAIRARALLNNKKWQEAADACKQVMDLKQYGLLDNYADIFNPDNEYNKEIIMDIEFVADHKSDNLGGQWYTFFFQWSSFMGLVNLSQEYYMANGLPVTDLNSGFEQQDPWKDRDPRLGYTFVLPYTFDGYDKKGNSKTYIPNSKKGTNFTSLRIRKWVDNYQDDYISSNSEINIILIRYADVLLMRAEALSELPNWQTHEQEIIGLVDSVRQRPSVNMPTVEQVEGTNLSQDQLRQIIRHERRVEFAYEGTRIQDIKRWDVGDQAYTDGIGYRPELLQTNASTYEKYVFRKRTFNKTKGYLWPIPSSEMSSNKAIGNNNPGY